jgi:hypothetical protein
MRGNPYFMDARPVEGEGHQPTFFLTQSLKVSFS